MVLAVAGSGRRDANSARLLAEALAGYGAGGSKATEALTLADLSFRGCIGCRACRESADACVLLDDLTPVLEATGRADALVLAAPIYYGYPSGLFKSYLDRWYGFRDGNRALRMREGRPALLILTQGHPDPGAYAWTRESLEKVLTAYGLRATTLVGAGLEGAQDATQRPELMARAREMGAALRG
ncbi:MAG: flavodoxin family protein [Thermodesulfobacteriota bacterium]